MPKMKTRRGAAKRFRTTSKGKIVMNHANAGHIFTKKSAKLKRGLRHTTMAHSVDVPRIKRMILS